MVGFCVVKMSEESDGIAESVNIALPTQWLREASAFGWALNEPDEALPSQAASLALNVLELDLGVGQLLLQLGDAFCGHGSARNLEVFQRGQSLKMHEPSIADGR